MNYDLIFSRGECGDKCWPHDCSSILGFGICTGLYIAKPSAKHFLENVFTDMKNKRYGAYSDQLTIMNIFKNANLQWINEDVEINGNVYVNKVTYYMNIKICVIDFDMFERGLYFGLNKQFGNHFPIDKVGGVDNFCKVLDNIDNLKLYAKETFKYKPNIFSNEEIELIHSI